MPYGEMPWVQEGRYQRSQEDWIAIDSAAWFAWLEQISAFCYGSQRSWLQLTVRKEKRGAHFYWYGYSKVDAKLHNVYLGKGESLSQERLERACERIHEQVRERRKRLTATENAS